MSRRIVLACFPPLLAMTLSGGTPRVEPGDTWRYQAVDLAPPPDGWQAPDFDDRGWSAGRAGFSVGYGGYHQAATAIAPWAGGTAVRGLALRRAFEVGDPRRLTALVLRMEYEDGWVGWLNGVEVARRGFPPDRPVTWESLPVFHPPTEAEVLDLSAHRGLLVPGTNVLAIQVLDAVPGSATLFAWPELRSDTVRGPYLQNVSSNRATIVWRTTEGVATVLEWAAEGFEGRRVAPDRTALGDHVAHLEGLEADTAYRYRVGVGPAGAETWGEPAVFRTFRPAGDADFLVVGDTGSGHLGQLRVADALRRESPDLVLHVGDVVYPGFTRGRMDLRCFSLFEPWMRRVPMFPTLGNHEVYGSSADYLEAFWLPTNTVTGTELFYAFDQGDVHFVSLLVPWWGISQLGLIDAQGGRSAQYRWLTNDLATTAKPWKVVYFHQPPKSSGPHAADDYDLDGRRDAAQMQEVLLPLLWEHGVQVVFCGHDHLWERLAPTNGLHVVVTGGGGAIPYGAVVRDPASAQVATPFHYVRAAVRGEDMTLEAVDTEGLVFDRFSIRREPRKDAQITAAWHTPAAPPDGASNEDGNWPGERFDLKGAGLPAVSRQAANLGQLLVNHDREGVHLGFRDVMLWPGQTVALFVANPRVAGVTGLAGVGVARQHPLSRLRLGFEGMEPAWVCLLGDEFADRSDAQFRRAGSSVTVGQGVFRLDAGLGVVEGARVRQFNRSPEVGPDFAEQNADFMVVTIPKAALGGVLPGDTWGVGAVVLTPELDSAGGEVRWRLDAGHLGAGLVFDGQGGATLAPARVGFEDAPDGMWGPELRVKAEVVEGRLRLVWAATVGRRYAVEATDRLGAPFASVALPGFPREATGTLEAATMELGATEARWFRVVELR